MCPQKPHIIINFRSCPNSRTWILRNTFLLNRNRRRKPLNTIQFRLLHLPNKHSRISRQTLHIPPLPFRIYRIKRKRRLPAPRNPCNYYKLILRNLNINILQIMLSCSNNFYLVVFHSFRCSSLLKFPSINQFLFYFFTLDYSY